MSYEVDTKQFEDNMSRYERELRAEVSGILRKGAAAYANRAVRYVPPRRNGAWTRSIPAKDYKRNVLYLPSQVKRAAGSLKKEYIAKLREGYRFVVKGQLHGKVKRWYATTLRKARTFTRIFNRGLFKAMFGANLARIGVTPPGIFSKLLGKSPNLRKHVGLNAVSLVEGEEAKVSIANTAWDNDKFARESVYQGDRAAKSAMKKLWKEFEKKRQEV